MTDNVQVRKTSSIYDEWKRMQNQVMRRAKDINIEVTPEDIVLKAETRHQHDEKKETLHMCEFESGSMFRSIHLPRRINPDKVKAELKNGLLRVTADIAESSQRIIKPEAA